MFAGKEKLRKSVSARIRYQLQQEKLSQSKLANAVGCSKDRIFSYVNGKISEERMDIGFLKSLADYFGLEPYYFCNDYHIFVDSEDVPAALKKLRMKSKVSQRAFAEKIKIPLASYKKYETGDAQLAERYWRCLRKELEEAVK